MTDDDYLVFKMFLLDRKKKQLEEEIEDVKLKSIGLKDGKKSIKQIEQFFKGV